ncbi:MAG: PD-(D/E)XK nuclease family protein [Polyangiaceae bacterium]
MTHIEGAARCPFAGFARRVLKTRRAEDLGEAADPRERGNLVHRALRARSRLRRRWRTATCAAPWPPATPPR